MAKKQFKFEGLVKQAEQQNKESTDYIRQNIIIDEELQKFIPPLLDEEFKLLEDNILKDGCRDALIVWEHPNGNYILIDGHNRYQICQKHNLLFKVQVVNFEDKEEAKDWMILNQLGKRNVTEEAKAYLRGLQYKQEKKRIGGSGVNQFNKDQFAKDAERTAERLASQHKVSEKTIRTDEKFAEVIDKITLGNERLKWDMLNRKVKFGKVALTNLSGEPEDILVQIGKNMAEGKGFRESINIAKKVEKKPIKKEKAKEILPANYIPLEITNPHVLADEDKNMKIMDLKDKIVDDFVAVVNQQDKQALERLREYLDELEDLLFDE
ncbi:MAG: hypothetical protein OHK0057_31960 [Thermoflexibacter sp.]